MRILIVDDDKVSREILFKVAMSYGKCDMAIDGIEAVEAFGMAHEEDDPYDVILLDIMMPLFDGNTVVKRIRAFEDKKNISKEKMVKVIIVSALYNPNLLDDLEKYGVHQCIRKPVNIELIKKALESVKTI